jgi:hypothetical protein
VQNPNVVWHRELSRQVIAIDLGTLAGQKLMDGLENTQGEALAGSPFDATILSAQSAIKGLI